METRTHVCAKHRMPPPSRRAVITAGAGLFLASGRPSAARAPDREEGLRAVVTAMARDHGFQGVAMLGRAGRPVFAQAVGMADLSAARPVRTDTQFGLASISKRLTAAAVMRLADRGAVTLDQPILAWLPWFRPETGARVTLRHLMSNTSGIPNGYGQALQADKAFVAPVLSTVEAVRRFAWGDLAFEPGARFDYAPTNWYLVQAIIETVAGIAYPDAMQQLLIGPLALTDVGLTPHADAARSYRSLSPLVEAPVDLRSYQAAPGGYYGTAADLLRFAHQVYDTDFLSRASRTALTTIVAPADAYALGGRVRSLAIGGETALFAWETGNTAGFRSVLGHRLDGTVSVALLDNTAMSQRTMDAFAEALLVAA